MKVGIDAIQMYIPKVVLPIEKLAIARNIEPAKLSKGLGLEAMRLTDIDEDVVSMGTTAVHRLLQQENIDLSQVDRLYVGTESSIDNSKPVASYILQNIVQLDGENKSIDCDAVDFTFACIGAVDALQNCLDYIRLNPTKKAIVVATDFAKYDLASTGEYTQGAGAFAVLVSADPKIMTIDQEVGVATRGVFDFFKPKQYIESTHGNEKVKLPVIKDEPVFDGQYSNECYINQISAAYEKFKAEKATFNDATNWDLICMHLPYCFQGRRTFIEIFIKENPSLLENAAGENYKEKLKSVVKSDAYQNFVQEKIAPSEYLSAKVGNCYTGSIFLGLISALVSSIQQTNSVKTIGFIGYGSGSKSKAFQGNLVENWQEHFDVQSIMENFEDLVEIDFETYEKLHKNQLTQPLVKDKRFSIEKIEAENPVLVGARYYAYKEVDKKVASIV